MTPEPDDLWRMMLPDVGFLLASSAALSVAWAGGLETWLIALLSAGLGSSLAFLWDDVRWWQMAHKLADVERQLRALKRQVEGL